ncbi:MULTISPECIES: peptidoglycan-binding domain-containing protein [Metabacillus]|uniref:Peptidoglycan binding-like domain-containing protein n=2 Tax=Metabacillus TaxID=2675233 RepID=A0A179T0W3_9BACI|nr:MULTISPECIES: peptidoglycan-binding protein [Metabacillus]OAS87736.1 hypothetical protein A6K24_18510 [Metabacillus litoralis]QNF30865.1 peptidoglycan-binding protein [Metabacillus sp. KUDC1714]
MYKKILISTLLATPLFALNLDPSLTHAATSSAQVNANIDLEYLKKNLGAGMSKSQVKQALGNEYTKGINHLNSHESWTYIIGKVESYEFDNPNNDAVDVDGIKNGKLKYHVSITFDNDILESVYIRYLDRKGKVAEYFKDDSGYLKDNGYKVRKSNSKFIDFGDRGEKVKNIQSQLMSKGFSLDRYGNDGVFGEETEKAVRAFQKQQGILVDGIVGPVTLKKLDITIENNNVAYPGDLVKKGSRGKNVERIQQIVGVTVDGIFGPKTEAAVIKYQKNNSLSVDGIVGPITWSKMF